MSLLTDNDKNSPLWLARVLAPLLALTLWLLSVLLGIIDIFAVWAGLGLLLTGIPTRPLLLWRDPVIFVLAVVLAVFAFNSGRYHLTYFNQPRSWRLCVITLAVELSLLAVVVAAYFIATL